MVPDILLAGHIVKDVGPDGWQPGGGVTFGAVQAARLGLSVAAVSSCSQDLEPARLVPQATWHVIPSAESTRFDNRYEAGRRSQRVLSRAGEIGFDDIPAAWRTAPIVLLTPVLGELTGCLATRLGAAGSVVGLDGQGWLRRLDGENVVSASQAALPAWLAGDVVFASEEDLLEPQAIGAWRRRVDVVVLTRGHRGSTVWDSGGRHDLSAFDCVEVDPTGAGDVFATAFLICYHERRDAVEAARFASAAAALAVSRPRLEGIAGREGIEALRATGQAVAPR